MRIGLQCTAFGLRVIAASMLSAAVLLFSVAASAAPPLSGAIFTTDVNGVVVNGNTIYEFKDDVYLDGGPGPNAPANAAGLPDDDYYFQVTDPSGKKLLSTDAVECRRFTVSGGVITSVASSNPACDHEVGLSQDAGNGITVQLVPYLDTPNNGGVYKVWVTPVGDGPAGPGFVGNPAAADPTDNSCGPGCFWGFIPARSKTDNFKVGDKTPTFCIEVHKVIVDKKGDAVPGDHWPFSITDPIGVENGFFTTGNGSRKICGLVAGTYTVEEELDGLTLLDVIVNGDSVGAGSTSVQVMLKRNNGDAVVVFINGTDTCDKGCK